MKTSYLLAFTLAIIALGDAQQTFGQQSASATDHRTLLGNRRADYTLDRDVMSIDRSTGHITALKFVIRQGTLTMHRCTVHFIDGETKDVVFLDDVSPSANSSVIMDVKDKSKTIDKVTFWYDTQDNSDKKSIIEVWAMN